MIDLSPETEELARRLAEARNLSVDETVREALETRQRMIPKKPGKDVSAKGVAARIAASEKIVAEMSKLPIIDPRPVQEIVDDINSL